ncbi:MAG TPA: hypothetical protein VNO83_13710 [Pseudonocardia sp.]|jgi:hypothetical protein|nr:hypothetical protein [Pseudonocardia sp.]
MTVDMGYETGGLRQGGSRALGAGQTAAGAAGILRGVSCPAGSLGQVTGAQALAAALARSRDAHVALGERVHSDHVGLNARAGQAAGDGDGLTTGTAAIARTGAPSGIVP